MKLIHCPKCHDVVRLIPTKWRMCECKACGGQYNDDLMSATIGGTCDVIGIPNPFFDEINKYLIEENGGKQYYRDLMGWGKQDIWYGGGLGDLHIHRIAEPKGPKLSMRVEIIDDNHTKSIFTDKRDFHIFGDKPDFVILENNLISSYREQNLKKPIKKNGKRK